MNSLILSLKTTNRMVSNNKYDPKKAVGDLLILTVKAKNLARLEMTKYISTTNVKTKK